MTNIELIKFFISQLALFSSFVFIFSILIRKNLITEKKNPSVNRNVLLYSILIIGVITFLVHFDLTDQIMSYYAISFIICLFVLNVLFLDIKNNVFLTFVIIIFNWILNVQEGIFVFENLKYIMMLLIHLIYAYLQLPNRVKGSMIYLVSHLYILIEITTFQYEPVVLTRYLFYSFVYTIFFVFLLKYLFVLNIRYKKYYQYATMDYLTGLYNDRTFNHKYHEIIEQNVKKANDPYCLIFLDLNNLKLINDQYGHMYGDEALKTVSYIMKQIWLNDFVARKSGDEFCIIAKGTQKSVSHLLNQFMHLLSETVIRVHENIEVTLSCAYGMIEINQQNCALNILDLADQAMYSDKKAQRSEGD